MTVANIGKMEVIECDKSFRQALYKQSSFNLLYLHTEPMAFRLIQNTAQKVAVIAAIVNIAIALILCYFGVPVYLSLPFLIVWIMVWLLGSSIDRKTNDDEVK